jgi:hypothetical protein
LCCNGVRQERLAREGRQEVRVRVIIDGITGRDQRRRGMIGLDVPHDVLPSVRATQPVSAAVACLREEDTKAHHEGEQDGWETGPPQVPHQPNITGGARRGRARRQSPRDIAGAGGA